MKRNPCAANAFVRWGGYENLKWAVGIATTVNPGEIARASTETPATWSVALTANAATPGALAGITVDVVFTITIGLGSATTTLTRTLVLSAANPSLDAVMTLPAATIAVTVRATPSAGPGGELAIVATALACPFSPWSFQANPK